jgi:hypothetical protein
MRRAPVFLLAVCLSIGAALPQSNRTRNELAERALDFLRSSTWASKAWGAYLAMSARDPNVTALLADEFRRARPLSKSKLDSPEYAFVQSLFNAVIELQVPIPVDVLRPFADQWCTEVLILLASQDGQHEDAEDLLLQISSRDLPLEQWYLANDLLYLMRSQRFFRRTLERLEIKNVFTLMNEPLRVGRGGKPRAGVTNTRRFPREFPPLMVYEMLLDGTQRSGDLIAAARPHIIKNEKTAPNPIHTSFLSAPYATDSTCRR